MGFFEAVPSELIRKLLGTTDSETLLQNVRRASKQLKIYSEIELLSRQNIEAVPFQQTMLILLANNITTFKADHINIHPELLKALTDALDNATKNPFLNYFHRWIIYQLLIILKNPESTNEISPLLRKKLNTEITVLSQGQLIQQSISQYIEALHDDSYTTPQTLNTFEALSFHKDLWSTEHLSKLIAKFDVYVNIKIQRAICLMLARLASILSNELYTHFLLQLFIRLTTIFINFGDSRYKGMFTQQTIYKALKLLIASKLNDKQCTLLLSQLLINLFNSKNYFAQPKISEILALLVPTLNNKQRTHLVSEFMRLIDENDWLKVISSETLQLLLPLLGDTNRTHLVSKFMRKVDEGNVSTKFMRKVNESDWARDISPETLQLLLSLLSDTQQTHLVSESMRKLDGEPSTIQQSSLSILQSLVPLLSNTQCIQLWPKCMLELDSKDKTIQIKLVEVFFIPLASRLGDKLSNTQRTELLSKLLIKLHDTDRSIQFSAYSVLASAMNLFNEPQDADELLKKLILDCSDEGMEVRISVCETLACLAPILIPILNDQLWAELWAKLIINLDYQKDLQVQAAACKALASLSLKLNNSQATMLVPKFMKQLNDQKLWQKIVVCESLVSVLLRLSDLSQYSEALCTLAKKINQKELRQDQYEPVRTAVCKAIVLSLPKLNNADLNSLLFTLADNNSTNEARLCLKQCIYVLHKSQILHESQIKLLQTELMLKLSATGYYIWMPALDVLSMPQMLNCFDSVIENIENDYDYDYDYDVYCDEPISILNDMITLSASLNNKVLLPIEPDNTKKLLKP